MLFDTTALQITTYSSSSLSATIPQNLMTAGTHHISVRRENTYSNSVTFTVNAATPPALQIIALNPPSGTANQTTPITVTGQGFATGAAILLDGVALATSFGSSTQVSATISAAQMTATTHTITVASGDQTSNGLSFSVTQPALQITSVSPANPQIGQTVNISVSGQGFDSGAQIVFDRQAVASTVYNTKAQQNAECTLLGFCVVCVVGQ